MTIREANLVDQPRLREMTRRFLAETIYGTLFATNDLVIAELVVLALERGVVFVSEVDDVVVGMIAVVVVPSLVDGAPMAEELCWWVEPEHRHSSIGPRLLGRAEIWAASSGATVVKMVAPAGSGIGAFYEHSGYVPLETAFVKRIG